jgi:hypothetical protein
MQYEVVYMSNVERFGRICQISNLFCACSSVHAVLCMQYNLFCACSIKLFIVYQLFVLCKRFGGAYNARGMSGNAVGYLFCDSLVDTINSHAVLRGTMCVCVCAYVKSDGSYLTQPIVFAKFWHEL